MVVCLAAAQLVFMTGISATEEQVTFRAGFTGITSRGFRRVLVQTILTLMISNLTHAQNYL